MPIKWAVIFFVERPCRVIFVSRSQLIRHRADAEAEEDHRHLLARRSIRSVGCVRQRLGREFEGIFDHTSALRRFKVVR